MNDGKTSLSRRSLSDDLQPPGQGQSATGDGADRQEIYGQCMYKAGHLLVGDMMSRRVSAVYLFVSLPRRGRA